MKKIFCSISAAMTLLLFAALAGSVEWNIDETCKITIVYLPSDGQGVARTSVPGDPLMAPLLKNIPAYKPDIDNILYPNILGLGFPLPARRDAAQLKLYLKLYAWPPQLDPVLSSHRTFDDFLLYAVEGGERLYESSRNPSNIYVKYALIERADKVFSERQPFPAPSIPKQWDFDSSLPFSTIYVTPVNAVTQKAEADRARASARGVVAFHASLTKVYDKALRLLAASAEKKVFADFRRCPDSAADICAVRIYEVPGKPMALDNYRELPMPQDADNIFLSGLLLVKLTEYAANIPMPPGKIEQMPPGTKAFEANFRPVRSHMLEVASVFTRR